MPMPITKIDVISHARIATTACSSKSSSRAHVTESVGNQAYNYALSVTHNEEKKTQYIMAGFKGGGRTGQLPRGLHN